MTIIIRYYLLTTENTEILNQVNFILRRNHKQLSNKHSIGWTPINLCLYIFIIFVPSRLRGKYLRYVH
jgi:hypothetical protein